MKRRRPPVFMCAVAASYIVYVAVTIYVWAVGPEAPGIQIAWMDDRLIIQKVFSGSPAAEAGIRPGDRALQVDGRLLRDYVDWSHVLGHLEVGRPLRLTVERAGEPVTSELTISQRPVSFWWSGSGVIGLSLRTGQLVYIALALLLVFAKPHDGVARTGALLLGAAAGVTPSPPGFAAEWREAPVVLHPFLWLFAVNESLGFGLLLTFFAMFPRPLPGFRTILIAGWAPLLAIQPWAIRFFLIERIYTRNAGLYPPDWLVAAIPVYWVVYPLAVIALGICQLRAAAG